MFVVIWAHLTPGAEFDSALSFNWDFKSRKAALDWVEKNDIPNPVIFENKPGYHVYFAYPGGSDGEAMVGETNRQYQDIKRALDNARGYASKGFGAVVWDGEINRPIDVDKTSVVARTRKNRKKKNA